MTGSPHSAFRFFPHVSTLHVSPSHADSPLQALRAATRAQHERIDRLIDLHRLADRQHYVRVLQVFDAFLATWERTVADALPARWGAWLQARSRRPFLRHDLQVLGAPSLAQDVRLPPFASPEAAWGSLYVLEGSALGGQVITQALAASGLRPDAGAAYFHGWGDATGAMWREFRLLLDRELDAPERIERACAAARLTFDQLTLLLEPALHERAAAA